VLKEIVSAVSAGPRISRKQPVFFNRQRHKGGKTTNIILFYACEISAADAVGRSGPMDLEAVA